MIHPAVVENLLPVILPVLANVKQVQVLIFVHSSWLFPVTVCSISPSLPMMMMISLIYFPLTFIY